MNINSIGVIYLCRAKEKKELFLNFITSYKKFYSNCDHELIIIFKGFNNDLTDYLKEIQTIFEGVDYQSVHLPDGGFDIGSYLATAKIVTHDYLLFFNTHTTIAADNWLDYLYKAIKHANVGLVGTTASYESVFTTGSLIRKFSHFYLIGKLKNNIKILSYYRYLVLRIDSKKRNKRFFNQLIRRIYYNIKSIIKTILIKIRFIQDRKIKLYGQFPNPHIRSNGFMISRKLLLELFGNSRIQTKEDACKFESGPTGLSSRIWQLGMKTLLIGKNGFSYDVKDWPNSNTFRLGSQENLLIHDNQTRNYDSYSIEERLIHAWVSWGDDVIRFNPEVPRLGFSFDVSTLKDTISPAKTASKFCFF